MGLGERVVLKDLNILNLWTSSVVLEEAEQPASPVCSAGGRRHRVCERTRVLGVRVTGSWRRGSELLFPMRGGSGNWSVLQQLPVMLSESELSSLSKSLPFPGLSPLWAGVGSHVSLWSLSSSQEDQQAGLRQL